MPRTKVAPRQGRHSLPPKTVRIAFALTADQAECLQDKLSAAREKHSGPGDDGAFLEAMLDQFLESNPEEFPAWKPTPKTVVLRQCPDCRVSEVDTADGPVEIQPEAVDAATPTADIIIIPHHEQTPLTPLPDDAPRDPQTPPELRHRVLARDGHRCRSCGDRDDLHAHHIIYRRHGGRTALSTLITLCDDCHALVHDRRIHITLDHRIHRGRPQARQAI